MQSGSASEALSPCRGGGWKRRASSPSTSSWASAPAHHLAAAPTLTLQPFLGASRPATPSSSPTHLWLGSAELHNERLGRSVNITNVVLKHAKEFLSNLHAGDSAAGLQRRWDDMIDALIKWTRQWGSCFPTFPVCRHATPRHATPRCAAPRHAHAAPRRAAPRRAALRCTAPRHTHAHALLRLAHVPR